jgi:hypothetical protein
MAIAASACEAIFELGLRIGLHQLRSNLIEACARWLSRCRGSAVACVIPVRVSGARENDKQAIPQREKPSL